MRTLVLFVLFGCFMVGATGRPSRLDEGTESEGEEEAEYEKAEGADETRDESSMTNHNEQSAPDEDAIEDYESDEAEQTDQMQDLGPNAELRHAAVVDRAVEKTRTDNFPGYKTCKSDAQYAAEDSSQSDNEYQTLNNNHQLGYNENNDAKANDDMRLSQLLSNQNFMNPKSDQTLQMSKNNVGSRAAANEDSDFLFDSPNKYSNENKATLRGYNYVPGESSEQSQYFKQYYNTMQANRDEKNYGNVHNSINRDRRQTQDNIQKDLLSNPTESDGLDNNSEEEEAAIKRHVKKLSPDELEELISSLSQDKRDLLKKIMDSDIENNNDSINKREITKKAGAAENSLESLTDSSRLQGASSSVDTNTGTPLNTGTTINTKQPETPNDISDLPSTTISEMSNMSGLSEITIDFTNPSNVLNPLNQLDISASSFSPISNTKNEASIINANSQMTSKTETKRETNLEHLADLDLPSFEDQIRNQDFKISRDFPNDQAYFCSQDDDLSQLTEEEFNLHNNNDNVFKREINIENDTDLSPSIKSLEESFPNLNAYDESNPYSGSDLAPHVRVKRKNEDLVVKKRAAALLPDAKVAYFPYRAENDDEDNDEGNEFDDDGFYDRTSSLTKNHGNEKSLDNDRDSDLEGLSQVSITRVSQEMSDPNKLSKAENIESEVSNLGSDTDSVLSGAEGVDENLMFSSGGRNRRMDGETSYTETMPNVNEVDQNHPVHSSTLLDDELKFPGDIHIGAPKYEESDAFGPLPRNYEGELSRYKRIRRVKQSPNHQEITNTDI